MFKIIHYQLFLWLSKLIICKKKILCSVLYFYLLHLAFKRADFKITSNLVYLLQMVFVNYREVLIWVKIISSIKIIEWMSSL